MAQSGDDNYWQAARGYRPSRRQVLKYSGGSAFAMAVLGVAGCSSSNNSNSSSGNKGGNTAAPSATSPAAAPTSAGSPRPAGTAAAGSPAAGGTVTSITAGTVTTEKPVPGGSLIVAEQGDPGGFDPNHSSTFQQFILTSTHNRLLGWKHGSGVSPYDYTALTDEGLAASVEQPDPQTVNVTLKPGINFHNKAPVNGRAVTAADAKFTFDRLKQGKMDPTSATVIDTVTAVDNTHLQIKLQGPYGAFVGWLAMPITVILAPEAASADGSFTDQKTVIGTGPYMLQDYQQGVKTSLVKNPSYFKTGKPYFDTYEYHPIQDESAREAAIRTGQIDLGWFYWQGVPPSITKSLLSDNKKLASIPWVQNSAWYIAGKADVAPFNDQRVRQALSLAVNRQQWINLLYEGQGFSGGAVSNLQPWFLTVDQLGQDGQYLKYDPQKAKQLLTAAGSPNGIKVANFLPLSLVGQVERKTDFLATSLKDAGFDLTVKQYDAPTFISKLNSRDFDVCFTAIGYSWDFDPQQYTVYYSKGLGAGNVIGINDPQLDAMLTKERTSLDQNDRHSTVNDIQHYLANQCYTTWEVAGTQQLPYNSALRNFAGFAHFDLGGMVENMWKAS